MPRPPALPLLICSLLSPAAMAAPKEGQYPPPKPPTLQWEDLLSGNLEDHWADMNCALHSPTFEMKADPDNAKGNLLHITRRPTGLIRSRKQYENFILECDWRHLTSAPTAAGTKDTTGNSGLYAWADPLPTVGGNFTRAIEVQVCNLGNSSWYTSHGDLFPIWGAKMTPDPRFGVSGSRSMPAEFRAKPTGEWNHIRVTCVDGTIQEEMNGAVVSAGFRASPRKGYLCIESEGGPIDFRHLRIHELPGDPKLEAKDVAEALPEGTQTTCLYNGVNLEGWTMAEGQKDEWTAEDHELVCAGKVKGKGLEMQLPKGDFTVQVDWKSATKDDDAPVEMLTSGKTTVEVPPSGLKDLHGGWHRLEIRVAGPLKAMTIDGMPVNSSFDQNKPETGPHSLRLLNPGHAVSFSNIILIQPPKAK